MGVAGGMLRAKSSSPHPWDILIVDDDQDCRETMTWLLDAQGYTVRAVASGGKALEVLSDPTSLPRLILLDIVMTGGLSGFDVLHLLQAVPSLADVSVVVVSGRDEPVRREEWLGAALWLRKPPDIDVLLNVVDRFVPKSWTTA